MISRKGMISKIEKHGGISYDVVVKMFNETRPQETLTGDALVTLMQYKDADEKVIFSLLVLLGYDAYTDVGLDFIANNLEKK